MQKIKGYAQQALYFIIVVGCVALLVWCDKVRFVCTP